MNLNVPSVFLSDNTSITPTNHEQFLSQVIKTGSSIKQMVLGKEISPSNI